MDRQDLASWIGPGELASFDVDASLDALGAAGITDLDADPAATLDTLVPADDRSEVERFAAEVYALAADGGTMPAAATLTVQAAPPRDDKWRCTRVSIDGREPVWIWLDGTVRDDLVELHETWQDACGDVEATARDHAQATDIADRAYKAIARKYEEARRARSDAIRAEVASGTTMHAVSKRLGVSPQAIAKIVHRS